MALKVILQTIEGKRIEYDSQRKSFQLEQAMPCFRCGICCTKWQPPVEEAEITTIAQALGMPSAEFHHKYIQEYPLRPRTYLIRRENNACIFLQYDNDKATCTIYPFRPRACRNWIPSLSRKECQEGLKRRQENGLLLLPYQLNLSPQDLAFLCRSLQNVISFRIP